MSGHPSCKTILLLSTLLTGHQLLSWRETCNAGTKEVLLALFVGPPEFPTRKEVFLFTSNFSLTVVCGVLSTTTMSF